MFGRVMQIAKVAVAPVAVGVVFTPAVGVGFAVGRELGWFAAQETEKKEAVEAEETTEK